MKKTFLAIILVISLSGCADWSKFENVMKVKTGMHYNTVEKILNAGPLKIDEVNDDDFRVWKNYSSPAASKKTLWMEFSRQDSILINLYSI